MLEAVKDILWGWHVLGLILIAGLSFSVNSKFFQIRKISFWLKTVLFGGKKKKGEISQFQALMTALAGSIGTGNIVGVAAAITVGGAGAIFWMWVSAIFGMMTIFAENMLSAKYKNAQGALGYIEKAGKHGKKLALFYAVGCVLSSLGMGNMVQSNAAAASLGQFGVPNYISGIILAATLLLVGIYGMKFAVKITEKLVPLMTVIFLFSSLLVLWIMREKIPSAFASIIEGAFSLRAGAGGIAGMLIAAKAGISRGVFTNEAGLGSSSFAYDEVRGKSPIQIGCMGIFQVFADTIVMCTVTALCILCCFAPNLDGARLTFFAFESALGDIGVYAVCVCTALFALATTVAWCCYGRAGLSYLTKGRGKQAFAVVFALAAFAGCIIPLDVVFKIGDTFNGLMAIPNLLALFYFSGEILTEIKKVH